MNIFVIKYLLNPSIALGLFLLFVLSSTYLGWSELFETVSDETKYIYIISSIFLFFIGLITNRFLNNKNYISGDIIKSFDRSRWDGLVFTAICIFFALEVIYSGYIPILHTYSEILDSNFGIPVFHGIFLAYLSYKSVVFFQQGLSGKNKKYIFFVVAINLIFILLARRGAIVFHFIAYAFIYIYMLGSQRKIGFKFVSLFLVSLLCFGLAFNFMGNYRLSKSDNDYILSVGKASQEFIESPMPNSLFFGYLYISTPVNVFDNNRINYNLSFTDFAFENYVPDFITKRLGYSSDIDLYIINGFTVGGIFVKPYYMKGIIGVILILIFYVIILMLVLYNIKKGKKRALSAMAMFFSLSILLTFQNLLNYSGYILPVYMALFFRDLRINKEY